MNKKNLIDGVLSLTVSTFFFMISGYVINVYIGRFLGPLEYGTYGIIIALTTVINLTQTAGLPLAVSKYIASDKNKVEEVYATSFILQLISTITISIMFFFLSYVIAYLLHDNTLITYIQLSALIIPFYGIFALLTGYYNGLHLFRKQALIHVAYSFLKICTIIPLAFFFHLYGVIYGFIIAPLFAFFFVFHFPKKLQIKFPYKKLITFSLPLILVAIFSNLFQSIDLFFIKALVKQGDEVGFYTADQNIARIPYYALTALSSVLFPSIAKSMGERMHKQTRILISRSLRIALLVIIPTVGLLSVTSEVVLKILYSHLYAPGSQTLSVLVIGSGFFTLFTLLVTIIASGDSPRKAVILSGLGVIITSCLCLLLIPKYGLIGGAIATTIAASVLTILTIVIVMNKFKIQFPFKDAFKIVGAGLLTSWITYGANSFINFFPFSCILFLCSYIGTLFLLREITKQDRELVISLMPSVVKKRFFNIRKEY